DEFPGAVILVSHDRAFMNEVCDEMIGFPEMVRYADMEQWSTALRKRRANPAAAANSSPSGSGASPSSRSASQRRKLSYNEQREFDAMESTILKKETKHSELQIEAGSDAVVSNAVRLNALMTEIASLQSEIERLYERWA